MQNAKCKRQNGRVTAFHFAFCFLLFAFLCGCQQPLKVKPAQQPAVMPSYHEVAQRYNAHLAGLDRLWARASVKLFFRDGKGRMKTETGEDSLLMFEQPYGVALSLGKLGKTGVWAGCNKDQYWLFDVIDSRTVWYGRTANLHRARDFPLPVHPQRLIALLGATPINPDVGAEHDTVTWDNGFFLIESPEEKLRLWIEPRTGMARQISLLDDAGEWLVVAKFSGAMAVEQANLPKARWPRLANRAEINIRGEADTFTMWLKDATDGRANPRIDRAIKQAFDFGTLVSALRPQDAVDLDR